MREDILPAFVDLTRDDQDSVRLIAVEAAGALAKVLPRAEVASSVMPAAVQCAQDKSWRVRYNAAQQVRGAWRRGGASRMASLDCCFLTGSADSSCVTKYECRA